MNLDCGHYVAGSGQSPIPAIIKLADRIASVELEYQVPAGSTSVIEVKKCVEYCRKALA